MALGVPFGSLKTARPSCLEPRICGPFDVGPENCAWCGRKKEWVAPSLSLADFDWQFNAEVIDRVRIETLAGGEFIGRRQNLVWVGQSGVGKSHLIQAIGLAPVCWVIGCVMRPAPRFCKT